MRTPILISTIIATMLIVLPSCDSTNLDAMNEADQEAAFTSNKYKKGNSTIVPGQQTDDGSIPYGTVTGKYKSVYTYDDNGDYYWDLGDGRIFKTVESLSELNSATLTSCSYEVVYKGDFNGDPFLDNGWIRNNIRCTGFDYKNSQTFNYLIIHETDRRYTPDLQQIWGTWAYLVNAVGGIGNIANPQHPVNE